MKECLPGAMAVAFDSSGSAQECGINYRLERHARFELEANFVLSVCWLIIFQAGDERESSIAF